MSDVIVIGSGPSGLYTAGLLADAGLEVNVFEKKRKIGKDIICTGIIGREAFKRFDLPKDSILSELKSMKMVSPYGTSLHYEHGETFACVVDREKFDTNLAHKAISCGAKIITGTRVEDIRKNKDWVEVTCFSKSNGKQKHRAKIAVLATGIEYRLHKKIGLAYPTHFINGAQVELEDTKAKDPCIFIGNQVAPGAFAWNIPLNSHKTRLGLITEKQAAAFLKKLIARVYPEKAELSDKLKYRSKIIAQGPVSRTYSDRVISVGESAAQVKTTTGGGLYYGLLCSQLAARIILRNHPRDSFKASDLSEYETAWKNAIKRELLIGYYARKTCSRLSDKEIEKLFQLAKTDGVFPLIRNKGIFDWQGNLILELAKKAPVPALKALIGIKNSK
jgi:digeranylgeranylglycerophospholipid reductase